jgi:IS4 transposase
MARKSNVAVRQILRKLFPSTLVEELSRDTGAVRRQRKVSIVDLFWTLVLGYGVGRKRTISGLRRAYEKTTGQVIEESSFYDRFNRGLATMMKRCATHALSKSVGVGRRLRGHLAAFGDVIMTDSTVIRLHDLLEDVFPACRTNHTKAALKAHAIISVTGAGKQSIKITSERRHDGPVFRAGRWVTGKLLLFDLGYFNYQLFACITRNKGYFVSRLKGNARPTIVGINRKHRGRAVPVVGEKLHDVVARLRREVLDVDIEVRFKRRRYAGKRRFATQRLRVVGVRDGRSGDYHLYVTNVPPDKLAAENIQATYALRWDIELLFKEMKQHYRLDDMPSRKRVIVETLVYAAIITLVASRRLLAAVRKRLAADQAERLRHQRWATVLESVSQELLTVVTGRYAAVKEQERLVARYLLHEAVDPNRRRPSLLQAVEAGSHAYRVRNA